MLKKTRYAKGIGLFAGLLALAAGAGCSADIDRRGHVFDEADLQSVEVGAMGREELFGLFGSPSILPLSGEDSWYYVGAEVKRFAFYRPEILERQVIAFRFDENGTVASVDLYALEDGQAIALIDKKTPSRGRDIGILEEIFGNIGRFTPAGVPQQ